MSNENWNNQPDPWERDTYQTGSIRPRKSNGGIVAILLVMLILLCGVVSIMTMLNIRLFQEISEQPDDPDTSRLLFETPESTAGSLVPETTGTVHPIEDQRSEDIPMSTSPTGVPNIPQEGGMALQDIYEKCIDSVVSIACQLPGGTSSGTGVVLSTQGYIITNAHVVEGATAVTAGFNDGRVLEAVLVGADEVSDLAVLKVEGENLSPAELGDSDVLRVGDTVVAIGDPLGAMLHGSMTDGIISGINRDITIDGRTMTLIQTTAALNEGNSGGPLINCYGQVIGINTMKIGDYMSTAGVEGLGFAIPSATVQQIVTQLIEQGYVSGRPTLGLKGESISTFYQMYFRLPGGLHITEVDRESDAWAKGIREGDILLSINDTSIRSQSELKSLLYSLQVGDVLTAIIYRDGNRYQVELTVQEANG